MEEEKRYYTVEDIQKILKISRPTAYGLLKKKAFKWAIVGRKYLISRQSFDRWLECFEEDPHGTE